MQDPYQYHGQFPSYGQPQYQQFPGAMQQPGDHWDAVSPASNQFVASPTTVVSQEVNMIKIDSNPCMATPLGSYQGGG